MLHQAIAFKWTNKWTLDLAKSFSIIFVNTSFI